jgi:hypothetical protein
MKQNLKNNLLICQSIQGRFYWKHFYKAQNFVVFNIPFGLIREILRTGNELNCPIGLALYKRRHWTETGNGI